MLKQLRRNEQGNVLILSVFFLMLFVFVGVVVNDVMKKGRREEALQQLADAAALNAASHVPSIEIQSYLTDATITQTDRTQGYEVGDHVLSNEAAAYIDNYARAVVRQYVAQNVINNEASGYYGGDLQIASVRPKFVANKDANDVETINYYVEVEFKNKWGSSYLGVSDDLEAAATARATLNYIAIYSTVDYDYDNPDPHSIFANGVYAKGSIDLTNIGGIDIIGDVHSDESTIKVNNIGPVVIEGSVSGPGDISITNVLSADISGDVTSEGTTTTDATVTVHGTETSSGDVPNVEMPVPAYPVDANDPNFPQPIIIIDGDYVIDGPFPPDPAVDPRFVGAENGGTLYVRQTAPNNGDIELKSGAFTEPDISGDWCMIAEADVHFRNAGNINNSDTDNQIFFMAGGDIHINNTDDVEIYGNLYALGDIHFNNVDDVVIIGGVYSAGDVMYNNAPHLTIIKKPMPNVIPPELEIPPVIYAAPPQYTSPVVTLIH